MFDIFLERFRQKRRTVDFPRAVPSLPPRFRGRPFIAAERCAALGGCSACADACPAQAVTVDEKGPALDMGRCLFCGDCARACPKEALVFTTDWRLASDTREALIIRPMETASYIAIGDQALGAQALPEASADPLPPLRLPPLPLNPLPGFGRAFRRSFRLRQVSAAGCGACEADLNVLGTVVFDIARFGLDYVASPRHADALLITGPVPRNMREALLACDAATPKPRAVIAVGPCAISGGLFRADDGGGPQRSLGAEPHLPVDLYIPGCPPHPYTSLDGFLRFLGLTVPGGQPAERMKA